MLVLNRKRGEEIVIGNSIRLTVLAIRGNRVRLGFTAPAETIILRNELCGSSNCCDRGPSSAASSVTEESCRVGPDQSGR